MDDQELKEFFKSTFNTVADGYDRAALSFFPDSAKHISSYLNLCGNEHVLDVATGTGCAALILAKDMPDCHVTGVDFSQGMLSQAMNKKDEYGLDNVTFCEMDMQAIEFPDNYFDVGVSAFSIFFVEDMKKQLSHIAQKIKDGGKIITTTFYDNAFSPLVDLFLDRLKKYGIEPPIFSWKRVATKQQCVDLFSEAGLADPKSEQLDCGYHLRDASDWWQIVWNAGYRGLVSQLANDELARFKDEHLSEVQNLASDKGIWLEMNVLYTVGTKRAGKDSAGGRKCERLRGC